MGDSAAPGGGRFSLAGSRGLRGTAPRITIILIVLIIILLLIIIIIIIIMMIISSSSSSSSVVVVVVVVVIVFLLSLCCKLGGAQPPRDIPDKKFEHVLFDERLVFVVRGFEN